MNNQYYQNLFGRLLEGRLSAEETDQLLDWLNREENAGEAASIIAAGLTRDVNEEALTADIRSALQARLPLILQAGKRAPVSIFRLGWFKYAAAAIVILALGIAFWSVQNKTVPPVAPVKQLAKQTDVAPGKQGAILTLADGRQVVLDSLGNGVVAHQTGSKVVLENGKLLYDAAASTNNDIVYNAISTPKGRQFQLVLPDGTRVWLNAASSLKYPTHFSGAERRVTVTGEAYFEVAHNAQMPFVVNVNDKEEVTVLGTHFNINAYDNEAAIHTTLLQGSVKVGRRQTADGRQETVLLKPGEQAIAIVSPLTTDPAGSRHPGQSGTSPLTIDHSPNIDKVMAWKNGVFNFNDASLQEVMHQLERWYDIEVQYEPGVPNLVFVGKMGRDLSLSNVLRGLELSKVHFRLEGRTLTVLP